MSHSWDVERALLMSGGTFPSHRLHWFNVSGGGHINFATNVGCEGAVLLGRHVRNRALSELQLVVGSVGGGRSIVPYLDRAAEWEFVVVGI